MREISEEKTTDLYLRSLAIAEHDQLRTLHEIVHPAIAKKLEFETSFLASARLATQESGLPLATLELFLGDYVSIHKHALNQLELKIRGFYEPS